MIYSHASSVPPLLTKRPHPSPATLTKQIPMSFFRGLAAPARVPTDRVIPLHFWDESPLYRRIALYNLKVFDDVLDPEKLRGSLETLVSQNTWRKLGGRLRKDVSSCTLRQCNACLTQVHTGQGGTRVPCSSRVHHGSPSCRVHTCGSRRCGHSQPSTGLAVTQAICASRRCGRPRRVYRSGMRTGLSNIHR